MLLGYYYDTQRCKSALLKGNDVHVYIQRKDLREEKDVHSTKWMKP